MNRYTKKILTIIAIGVFAINIHLFNDTIINKAEAQPYIDANYDQLFKDRDFKKAIKMIITRECGINGSKITCR